METMFTPSRYDLVSFTYKGRPYSGEVRRVYSKPKGHLMILKIEEGKYRSCYLEQCENLVQCGDVDGKR
jgi:hypothetical protein